MGTIFATVFAYFCVVNTLYYLSFFFTVYLVCICSECLWLAGKIKLTSLVYLYLAIVIKGWNSINIKCFYCRFLFRRNYYCSCVFFIIIGPGYLFASRRFFFSKWKLSWPNLVIFKDPMLLISPTLGLICFIHSCFLYVKYWTLLTVS